MPGLQVGLRAFGGMHCCGPGRCKRASVESAVSLVGIVRAGPDDVPAFADVMAGSKAEVGRVPVRSARKRIEVSVVVMMNAFMSDDKRRDCVITAQSGAVKAVTRAGRWI